MYTLRGLLALTLVIAIIFGLWRMGEPTFVLGDNQKIKLALLATVLSLVAFASLLSWIREGERAKQNSRFATVAIDMVAFLGTCCLMIAVCRLAVNALLQ